MFGEQLLVFLIVGGAALYLALRHLRGRGGCGGCERGCDSVPAEPEDGLVQLELRPRRREQAAPRAGVPD